VFALTSPLGLP